GAFGWRPQQLAFVELARRTHRRRRRPTHEHAAAGRWLRKARAMRARAKVIRATMPNPDAMLAHFERPLSRHIQRAQRQADRELADMARRMIAPIEHRGPDDSGIWADADAGIAFGFRRLAIIDLSPSGHQPMWSPSRRYVATFNGEVYNFAELRHDLQQRGFR